MGVHPVAHATRGQVITLTMRDTAGRYATPAKFEVARADAQEITLRSADGRIVNIML